MFINKNFIKSIKTAAVTAHSVAEGRFCQEGRGGVAESKDLRGSKGDLGEIRVESGERISVANFKLLWLFWSRNLVVSLVLPHPPHTPNFVVHTEK